MSNTNTDDFTFDFADENSLTAAIDKYLTEDHDYIAPLGPDLDWLEVNRRQQMRDGARQTRAYEAIKAKEAGIEKEWKPYSAHSTESFDETNKAGRKAEVAFRDAFKARGVTLTESTTMEAQHKGDFTLTRQDGSILNFEVKQSSGVDTEYGSIYVELAEAYDKNYDHNKDKQGTIELTGPFKQASKAIENGGRRTIFATRLGNEGNGWLLFEPEKLINFLIEQPTYLNWAYPTSEGQFLVFHNDKDKINGKGRWKISLILLEYAKQLLDDHEEPIIHNHDGHCDEAGDCKAVFFYAKTDKELPALARHMVDTVPMSIGSDEEVVEAFRRVRQIYNLDRMLEKKGLKEPGLVDTIKRISIRK